MYDTYPEDFFRLQRQIRMRKIDSYLMDVAIVANPHKGEDSKEFVEALMKERRFFRGIEEIPDQLDIAAFNKFREDMKKESIHIKAR